MKERLIERSTMAKAKSRGDENVERIAPEDSAELYG